MKKLSKNKKLNSVLNTIYEDLQELGIDEIKRYKKEFPREKDYNIAQYGNMLIYFDDVREMYNKAGYKTIKRLSNEKVWQIYLHQVRYVANLICEGRI